MRLGVMASHEGTALQALIAECAVNPDAVISHCHQ